MKLQFYRLIFVFTILLLVLSCSPSRENKTERNNFKEELNKTGKPVIYQVFTRLFGNKNMTNRAWGTIEENGVGKFEDFTDKALEGIKEFGVSHIWYTGVLHHAVIRDYTKYGISNDDPDVVKGRAGSPYAVKDYYNVDPDLAMDPAKRLEEFKNLIERTHKHDMKVIIDIVPNHIARNYQSTTNPTGVMDFGAEDDTSVEYKRDNNFYYIPGKKFEVPIANNRYRPLNGEIHPLSDQQFDESPAKWTGNGSRKAQPDINDWYETVKVNFGVKPDGSFDFTRLPNDFSDKNAEQHFNFWNNKVVPDSWKKYKDIVLYWTGFGVDGFRYDMAEMVPVEFWSYLNSAIKNANPEATLIAEVYNPKMYRDYIALGKMDYLYDKVDFYDTLKKIMQGRLPTSNLLPIVKKFSDIDQYLLHFLENHDEQRIASPDFAGDSEMGKPAMVVSALIGKAPTMLFYGQALGESGDGDAGFGDPTRTTIFDYWGVSSVQRWMNGGKFDGGALTEPERALRKYYVDLLSFSATSSAMTGEYYDLHSKNISATDGYNQKIFSFARFDSNQKVIVVSNFAKEGYEFEFFIPETLIKKWHLQDGVYQIKNIMSGEISSLSTKNRIGVVRLKLGSLESKVFVLND